MLNNVFMRSSNALSKSLRLGIVGLCLLFFQACVHAPPVKEKTCREDPAVYERALVTLSRSYRSLSGVVKARVATGEEAFSFTGDLYAQAPDKLHFDIFGFLHRPRFVLIKDGERIAWKDFYSGRAYRGPLAQCPGFPVKFPFSPLFLRDFMKILFLDFPGGMKLRPLDAGEGACRFVMDCEWGTFDVTMNPSVNLPSLVAGPKGNRKPFRMSFTDYAEVSSLHVPRRYEITVGEVTMTFTFKRLEVNPTLSPEIFVPRLSP